MPARKTVAEFFAGIGLMRLGLEQAGWKTTFANDIDQKKKAMYEAHFGAASSFVLGDIHALPAAAIPNTSLATASFPCTDLSLAGGREGLAGKHSSAFWGFINLLSELGPRRPPLVLLENVVGFLTSHGGADLRSALLALNALNYAVDAFIIDAASFVPQSRTRLFVVGLQRGRIAARVTLLDPEGSEHRPAALARFITAHPEITWSIRELPALPQRTRRLEEIIEALPPNSEQWWDAERASYLLGQMSARHRSLAEAMIRRPAVSIGTIFRRVRQGKTMAELRVDGLAGCLRTPRGGSGRQILFAAGKGEYRVRLFTPRECARLMGADDFKIEASLNQALFGFGDAVCAPVIRWIAEHYLSPALKDAME